MSLLRVVIAVALLGAGLAGAFVWKDYGVKENIISTIFWVGEAEHPDNGYIANDVSAWNNRWQKKFGGVDDPNDRNGFFPAKFRPKENPFYVALPYNDFDGGERKLSAQMIPWAKEKKWGPRESMCKGRWVRISKYGKTAYAQWEDVGPFLDDDFDYVFGNARPRNKRIAQAGIDVSPAVATYLDLEGIDTVDWKFVHASKVPRGPWSEIKTTSKIVWK